MKIVEWFSYALGLGLEGYEKSIIAALPDLKQQVS
jgi:hypothetical protein